MFGNWNRKKQWFCLCRGFCSIACLLLNNALRRNMATQQKRIFERSFKTRKDHKSGRRPIDKPWRQRQWRSEAPAELPSVPSTPMSKVPWHGGCRFFVFCCWRNPNVSFCPEQFGWAFDTKTTLRKRCNRLVLSCFDIVLGFPFRFFGTICYCVF